ncbi:hypothetical protein [Planifilum fimeticola]|jgi:hypothetical protein
MEEQKGQQRKRRSTTRLLGLFAAASLLVASGCDDNRLEICYDDDNDLLCDDDLSEVDADSYVVINGKKWDTLNPPSRKISISTERPGSLPVPGAESANPPFSAAADGIG